jgi:acyl-CoA reductase-like NAD-dependent aldehyde dehydrogenase
MAVVAPAPAVSAFLEAQPKRLLIGGEWKDGASGRTFNTINPATGERLATVAEAGPDDVDAAVSAARKAYEGPWRKLRPSERARLLWRLADAVNAHEEELAQLETLDNGKPVRESKIDIRGVAEHFRYHAGWCSKLQGATIPVSLPGTYLNYTVREPVGVVGAIVPWNFPLLIATWKLAPALACGNTVVLKPAHETPLTALRLGELAMEVGFPPGVVNVVPGPGSSAGAALAAHPGVDKVAFTGSTEVGREIIRASAGNLKRVSLELGGKSPNIVFADADLPAAVKGAFNAIFFNQGQMCSAGSRLFVARSIYDEFLNQLSEQASKIRQGPGLDPDTQMGPLISAVQLQRVQGFIETGRREGAVLRAGGERATGDLARGFFIQPTVFADAKDDMTVVREEIFGPVVVAMPFEELDEVIARANATAYGLAAGVWTRDLKTAHRVAAGIRAGTVWVNCYNLIDPASPWGGYKESGYGRDMGEAALHEYTELKNVLINLG